MNQQNPTLGPTFVKHSRKVAGQRQAKANWPYDYIFPPEDAVNVAVGLGPTVKGVSTAGIAMPAAAAPQVVVMQYQVPNGFRFWLHGVILAATLPTQVQPPFASGDGSAFWTLDVDQELGDTFPSGSAVKDFAQVQTPLGSWALGPFPLKMPIGFEARHILRWKFTNVSCAAAGVDSTWISAGLFGFLVPED